MQTARAAATESRARKAVEVKKAARKRVEREERQSKQGKKAKGAGSGKVRNPYKFKQLEERIITLEGQLETLNASMTQEAVYTDQDKLRDVQFQVAEVERQLEEANEEWASWG